MTNRLITMLTCSALGVIGSAGVAHSDSVGRYECTVLGTSVGLTGSGRAVVKLASGSLANLSGRTLEFVNKSIGFNRFDIEWSERP